MSHEARIRLDNDKDFHHPYTPYDIQIQFMRALYTCIEEGKVGIFESPTGKNPLHLNILSQLSLYAFPGTVC